MGFSGNMWYNLLASSSMWLLLYTILASIEPQWIFNFTICEIAVNAVQRRNMLINLSGVRLIGIGAALARTFHWIKNHFKVCIHHEWGSKLVLSIIKFYGRSFARHLYFNGFVIIAITIMLVSARFQCKTL